MPAIGSLLLAGGVVLTMSEVGGLWPFGCSILGSLSLVTGMLVGR